MNTTVTSMVDLIGKYIMPDRSKYLGGSDIPAIMGKDKYGNTLEKVYSHKTGFYSPKDISNLPHVRRGIDAEPHARKMLNEIYETTFSEIFVKHADYNFMGGNLDGYSKELGAMLEIKTTGLAVHRGFLIDRTVPPHHYLQCQYYMMLVISNCKDRTKATKELKCIYANYRPENNSLGVTEFKADTELHKVMRDNCVKLWQEYIDPMVYPTDFR